jgi:hypothetical protein
MVMRPRSSIPSPVSMHDVEAGSGFLVGVSRNLIACESAGDATTNVVR